MANIRVTNALRAHVQMTVINLYTDSISAVEKSMAKNAPFTAEEVYDLIVSPWKATMDQLPEEFFFRAAVLRVATVATISTNITYTLPLAMPFPMAFPGDYDVAVRNPNDGRFTPLLHIGDSVRWSALVSHVRDHKTKHDDLIAQRDAARSAASQLLDKHKTVNAALREWPALRTLLPPDTIKRLDAPSSRTAREATSDVAVNMDVLHQVTATLARKRIGA
jgi:hypothetical protein